MTNWRPIKGWEDHYMIDTLGRVFSFKTVRFIKGATGRAGYRQITLSNGAPKQFKLHRLIAQAFIPNPQNKRFINHINGLKTDNKIENLEWVTNSENVLHSYRVLGQKGYKKPNTHCKYGHALIDGNLVYHSDKRLPSGVRRDCSICYEANWRKHYLKKKLLKEVSR